MILSLRHQVLALFLWLNILVCSPQTFQGTTVDGTFSCHCSGGTQCTSDTGTGGGHCPSGCDTPFRHWPAWSDPGCQIGNAAYGKPAYQNVDIDSAYPASNAVDGNINRNVRYSSQAGRPSETQGPSWYVDLQSNHVVEQVQITTVEGHEETRNDIQVFVSSDLQPSHADQCRHDQGSSTLIIDCDNKVGRYAIVRGINSNEVLWLAEVYVKGYKHYACNAIYDGDYWFGPACLNNCHCDEQCDPITSICLGQCKPGYMGDTCQEKCGPRRWGIGCMNTCHCQSCDAVTGDCGAHPCDAGYYGAACDTACGAGTWGSGSDLGCRNRCNCANTNEDCRKSDGHCSSGCAQWYTEIGCDYALPRLGVSAAPVRVGGNGRNVTIRFAQWHPQYGGDADESDISYKVEYASHGDSNFIELETFSMVNISKNETHEAMLMFPETRKEYTVRIVPYEISDNYEGPGEPSPSLLICTDCADGRYGNECEFHCQCENRDVCNKVDGFCNTGVSTDHVDCVTSMIAPVTTETVDPINTTSKSGSATIYIIIAAIVTFAVLLIIVSGLLMRRFKKKPNNKNVMSVSFDVDIKINKNTKRDLVKTEEECEKSSISPSDMYIHVNESHNNKYGRGSKVNSIISMLPKRFMKLKRNHNFGKYTTEEFITARKDLGDLTQEYTYIPENENATTLHADAPSNDEKHRFMNIKAYDHSRVVLDKTENMEDSDYINACYVDGYNGREKMYVAAQGPRKPTVNDMWRMIWTVNARVIVMLTNLVEGKKVKCQQYWPNKGSKSYHGISVVLLERSAHLYYTKQRFSVNYRDESREIVHLQFTRWPDHDVPDTSYDLLEFYHFVRSYLLDEGQPLLVHCSAGVGRTGTFIALDYLVQQAAHENAVDVFGCVTHLRKFRQQMVQTASQYQFLHIVLRCYLELRSSAVKSEEYTATYANSFGNSCNSKWNSLQKSMQQQVGICSDALKPENIGKNRDTSLVPTNKSRLFLSTPVHGTNDYINAVFCDSYNQANSLILTQVPLTHTIADLWRLAFEQQVSGIITLAGSLDEQYWSGKDQVLTYGPLQITTEEEEKVPPSGIIIRHFLVKHCDQNTGTSIRQWHFDYSSEDMYSDDAMKCWLTVYDQVQQYKKQQQMEDANRSPTIVQCMDGCSRSGLFAVLWSVLEKLSVESVVNIDFAIRRVRKHRPQAVLDVQQYMALNQMVKMYIDGQDSRYYYNM